MKQETLFNNLGYPHVLYKGQDAYVSPNHNYYYLKETDEYVTIVIQNEQKKKADERLRLYKIWQDDDMMEVLCHSVIHYEEQGDNLFRAANIFPTMAKFVRDTIHKKIGERELKNLCILYDAGVRAGGLGFMITDACREVLDLFLMDPGKYVSPELHEKLKQLPDIYYQFLVKTEMNLGENPKKQKRLLKYMEENELRNTSEVIMYVSYLTENIEFTDELITGLIQLYRSNIDIGIENVKDRNDEKIVENNTHEWKLVSLIIDNRGYRFRHCGPIILMDYEDRCMGDCALKKISEGKAEIVRISVNDELMYPGSKERLLKYAENAARSSGVKELQVNCTADEAIFFMKQEYTRVPGESLSLDRQMTMKKILN